ncbi:uncharacterized protein LOC125611732 [Marmota marmota marmota]|uniref:uncharacterized protein LOC125611732 n=1 Tax=Marmota marmota marmota TaxID=9994 RepID=UPI002093FF68|nr:uncharacterized protein LOC125611732 [Marmota marmota marmota]
MVLDIAMTGTSIKPTGESGHAPTSKICPSYGNKETATQRRLIVSGLCYGNGMAAKIRVFSRLRGHVGVGPRCRVQEASTTPGFPQHLGGKLVPTDAKSRSITPLGTGRPPGLLPSRSILQCPVDLGSAGHPGVPRVRMALSPHPRPTPLASSPRSEREQDPSLTVSGFLCHPGNSASYTLPQHDVTHHKSHQDLAEASACS